MTHPVEASSLVEPTTEEVLSAIDKLVAEGSTVRQMGHDAMVPWSALAFALFPRGSGFWARPKGKPHGQDRSAAVEFMDALGFNPAIRRQYSGGQHFYGRRSE